MPIVLAANGIHTGKVYYLAEDGQGGFYGVDCPVNAAMWEDYATLDAWFATLSPELIANLDGILIQAVEVDLDLTGTTFPERRRGPIKRVPEPKDRPMELTFSFAAEESS